MKISLRIIGLLGVFIFGFFFVLTYGVPGYVEEVGKHFIKQELTDTTNEKIDSLAELNLAKSDNKVVKLAAKILEKNQQEIAGVKLQLKNDLHIKLAAAISEMRDLDCECRKKYEQWYKEGFEAQITSLEKINERLSDFIKGKYMQIANELKRDIRIFTLSNAMIFLLLILVSLFKPRAVAHLFLPAILLTISTTIIAFFYIFEQNWLMTIIYNNYWGFGYLAYVGVLFLFLCDIVFNYARVTTSIINGILEGLGSALSVSPC